MSFESSAEARAYVARKIVEQAAVDAVSLTSFERRLIYGSLTEQETEEFDNREDEYVDDLWEKLSGLIRAGLSREKRESGRAAYRRYRRANGMLAAERGFLSGIIAAERLAPVDLWGAIHRGYLKWLMIAMIGLAGGMVLAALLVFQEHRITRAAEQIRSSRAVHWFRYLLDNYGAGLLIAALVTSWFAIIVPWMRERRSTRSKDDQAR